MMTDSMTGISFLERELKKAVQERNKAKEARFSAGLDEAKKKQQRLTDRVHTLETFKLPTMRELIRAPGVADRDVLLRFLRFLYALDLRTVVVLESDIEKLKKLNNEMLIRKNEIDKVCFVGEFVQIASFHGCTRSLCLLGARYGSASAVIGR